MVQDNEFFSDVGLTVNVFYWSYKHSTQDTFFQQYCNPYYYPMLQNDDRLSWYFNSSIVEQTNVWFGGMMLFVRRSSGKPNIPKHTIFVFE